jgi:hypothetical protein
MAPTASRMTSDSFHSKMGATATALAMTAARRRSSVARAGS